MTASDSQMLKAYEPLVQQFIEIYAIPASEGADRFKATADKYGDKTKNVTIKI